MECWVLFWPSQDKRDGRVQQRSTEVILGLGCLLCEQRLRELGVFSLEKRRLILPLKIGF